MKLTLSEINLLKAILTSPYHDDISYPNEVLIDWPIRTKYLQDNTDTPYRTILSLLTGLAQKKLIGINDEYCWVTRMGYHLYTDLLKKEMGGAPIATCTVYCLGRPRTITLKRKGNGEYVTHEVDAKGDQYWGHRFPANELNAAKEDFRTRVNTHLLQAE